MCLHFEVLFTSERSSTFLGVSFWGIFILGVVFIFRAVFIGIPTMNYCIIKCHKAEYVQRCVCFANVKSSLHENVVFSVCALMGNAA